MYSRILDGSEDNDQKSVIIELSYDSCAVKELIQQQVSQPKWGKESVACVVAAEAKERTAQGMPLNCFVLDRGDGDEKTDELIQFLNLLKKNVENIEDNTRFQLLVQTGDHWTTCDVTIKSKTPIIFILDSANIIKAVEYIDKAVNKFFQNAKSYVYFPDEIPDDKIEFETIPRRIQVDEENCSIFSLDQAFRLARVDVAHEFKESGIKGIRSAPDNYFKVNPNNCPENLSFIFKNIQSLRVASSLPEKLKNKVFHDRYYSLKLFESINSTSIKIIDRHKNEKLINAGIQQKKLEFVERIEIFLANHAENDLKKIIDERTGFKFLTDINYRKSVTTAIPTDLVNPGKAIRNLIILMLAETSNLARNYRCETTFRYLIGNDNRTLTTLESEFIGVDASLNSMHAAVHECQELEQLTTLAAQHLLGAINQLRSKKNPSLIGLLNNYRASLKEKFELHSNNTFINTNFTESGVKENAFMEGSFAQRRQYIRSPIEAGSCQPMLQAKNDSVEKRERDACCLVM